MGTRKVSFTPEQWAEIENNYPIKDPIVATRQKAIKALLRDFSMGQVEVILVQALAPSLAEANDYYEKNVL